LFQLTVPIAATFSYNLNLQIFPNNNAQNAIRYVWDANNVGCANLNEVDGSGLGLIGGSLYGCDDPEAINYNPDMEPGGTCYYLGCTDDAALNYDPQANLDNGMCVFQEITNNNCQNPIILIENEPVVFSNFGGQLGGVPAGCWTDQNINAAAWAHYETETGDFVVFVEDSEITLDIAVYDACSGSQVACTEGVSTGDYFHLPDLIPALTYILVFESNDNGAFEVLILEGTPGCTDENASNFNADAAVDDGSCEYIGCMDPQACNYSPYFQVDDGSCDYQSIVIGTVYSDLNGNGFYDNNFFYHDPVLQGQQILIAETGEILFSDSDGAFSFTVPEGETYTLTLIDTDNIFTPFPDTQDVPIFGANQCDTYNLTFGMSSEAGIEALGIFSGAYISTIHCYNGKILNFYLYNLGDQPFDGTINMTFDPVLQAEPHDENIAPTSFGPGIVTWEFEDQMPGEYLTYSCHIIGPGVDYMNDIFGLNADLTLYDDNQNLVYNLHWQGHAHVMCAYDPNDKQATPVGYAEPHFILPDEEMEYKIRFQNTGNAPAEYVIITDTLDVNTLDISSFQPVISSHNVSTSLLPNGLVTFTFNNINLPDSASDPLGSEGFVVYRIRPRLDISPGTEINNTAYIYFEQNPPIITNTTWHTIYDCSELELLDGSETAICPEGNASLEISYPYVESLEWSINGDDAGSGNTILFNGLEPGDYEIELIAANPLCSASSNASLHVWESPTVSISENQALITATSGYESYQWYFEGEIIDGANASTLIAEESGDYAVAITDSNGCTSMSDELFVTIIGIDENQIGFIALYPNPMKDFATIQFATESNNRIVRILDVLGKEISTPELANSSVFHLERNALPAGNYLIEIKENNQITYLNLMVE
jgi:uncharacterized repeat protein (TIGR01451 family)